MGVKDENGYSCNVYIRRNRRYLSILWLINVVKEDIPRFLYIIDYDKLFKFTRISQSFFLELLSYECGNN